MKKNMGFLDRIIRMVFATIAVVLITTDIITGVFATVLLSLVVVLVVTSFFHFCPLYFSFGINTKKKIIDKK